MKNYYRSIALILTISFISTINTNAQSVPTVAEVNNFINNNHFLITYREGEVVYGTYYFIEIHYCPSGLYGLYGKSVKQTVMGNEQRNNWQEYGSWKVINYNGSVGIYYKTTAAQEKFVPAYRLPDGNISFGEGVTIVKQGKAICNM
jgi:hypothetical protein